VEAILKAIIEQGECKLDTWWRSNDREENATRYQTAWAGYTTGLRDAMKAVGFDNPTITNTIRRLDQMRPGYVAP
jgi:hypothetical protein